MRYLISATLVLSIAATAIAEEKDPKKLIVGHWQQIDNPTIHYHYSADDKFILYIKSDENTINGGKGTYKWLNENTLDVDFGFGVKGKQTVKVTSESLTVTTSKGTMKFKRLRK